MKYLDNLKRLERIAFFQAPKLDIIKPYQITKGYELIEVLLGGKILFNIDGEIQECRKGAIFWHIEGDKTLSLTDKNDPYRCMVFAFQVEMRRRPLPRVTYWEDLESLDKFTSEAINCFHNTDFNKEIMGTCFYSQLYWQAYKSLRRPVGIEYPRSLCKAVQYIERYLDSDLTVDDIALKAGVSKPYLFALFQKYLKLSPHKYLINCRLNRAQTMLAGTAKSIKEIASFCGYESIECFYRSFKKHSGVTPAAYRSKYSPYPRVLREEA